MGCWIVKDILVGDKGLNPCRCGFIFKGKINVERQTIGDGVQLLLSRRDIHDIMENISSLHSMNGKCYVSGGHAHVFG